MTRWIVFIAMLGLAIAMPAQVRAQQPAKASDLTSRGVIAAASRQAYEQAIDACAGGVAGKMPQGARFVRCLNQKVMSERNALVSVYRSTLSSLSSPDQAAHLRKAQRAWLDYRDANCAFAKTVAPKEEADAFFYDCLLKATIDRRAELSSLVGD